MICNLQLVDAAPLFSSIEVLDCILNFSDCTFATVSQPLVLAKIETVLIDGSVRT